MALYLYRFLREEDGQDLIEYSLLITFIAIACAALIGSGRPAVNQIWITSNSELTTAASQAGS
jgi:Flp pilus assembly pilin Flp